MRSIRTAECNATLSPPKGWDPAVDGDCHELPLVASKLPNGTLELTSTWELTVAEIESLKAGAKVKLCVLGAGHPPVKLWVEPSMPLIYDEHGPAQPGG